MSPGSFLSPGPVRLREKRPQLRSTGCRCSRSLRVGILPIDGRIAPEPYNRRRRTDKKELPWHDGSPENPNSNTDSGAKSALEIAELGGSG